MVYFIGLAASTLTMFSFVPQVVKMYKCKSARDVSIATILQLAAGVTLWTVYGVLQKDPIIIFANLVTLAILLAAMYLYHKYSCRG